MHVRSDHVNDANLEEQIFGHPAAAKSFDGFDGMELLRACDLGVVGITSVNGDAVNQFARHRLHNGFVDGVLGFVHRHDRKAPRGRHHAVFGEAVLSVAGTGAELVVSIISNTIGFDTSYG